MFIFLFEGVKNMRKVYMVNYQSALYRINRNKKVGTKVCFEGYNNELLPKELDIKTLSKLLSKMQKICFQDNKVKANEKRLKELFLMKEERTIAVVLSLGYEENSKGFMDIVDGSSATLQLSNQGIMQYQQPWINEVCRSNLKNASGKPTNNVMDMIDIFISKYMMPKSKKTDGAYLYIEKEPEHGSGDFLLNYYTKYDYKKMDNEDEDYYYMGKKYNRTTRKERRKRCTNKTCRVKCD